MVSFSIRRLSERLHDKLRRAAAAVNRVIVSVLGVSMEERARRRSMREGREEFRRFLQTLPPMSDSTELIREDRLRRHR
jgi:hypothetical protein